MKQPYRCKHGQKRGMKQKKYTAAIRPDIITPVDWVSNTNLLLLHHSKDLELSAVTLTWYANVNTW